MNLYAYGVGYCVGLGMCGLSPLTKIIFLFYFWIRKFVHININNFEWEKFPKKIFLCIYCIESKRGKEFVEHGYCSTSFLCCWLFYPKHGFQNRTGPGGRTVKTENRDENRFFKPKEPDFLLIPWTVKTKVGPYEPVRTVRSNPLAI